VQRGKQTSGGRRRTAAPARGAQARLLRIIGGAWRGRRLRFPARAEIRPTPDRVRETLFNWLGAHIVGTRCLDLFAGSGALGLEALSRGARHVEFVDQHAVVTRELARVLAEWNITNAHITRCDALAFLQRPTQAFGVVFLDPPFEADLLGRAAQSLESRGWLAQGALIYVECAARAGLPQLPATWKPLKAKRAGEVGYHLFVRATEPDPAQ
jgi:16S rRNA (guanine966-N2)-methyltransferase